MAKNDRFAKPFDGAVSRYVRDGAPKKDREVLKDADDKDILDPKYPYRDRLDSDAYDAAFDAWQSSW